MIKPIKTSKEYKTALARIYALIQEDIAPGSDAADELEIRSILVKDYENKNYPMEKPNPLEAIRFRLEQLNLTETQLSEMLGYRSRKSEILSGKRKLNLTMIRKLNEVLQIPAEVLIKVY